MITHPVKEIRQQKEHWGWRLEVKEGGGRTKSEKGGGVGKIGEVLQKYGVRNRLSIMV